MKNKAILYHADCPICVAAALDRNHRGRNRSPRQRQGSRHRSRNRRGEFVPALVTDDTVYHVHFGADLSVLK
jgi:hypothetical protein